MLNNCIFGGHLGRDPVMTELGNNRVASFSIAVNSPPRKDGVKRVTWIECKAWGKIAENICKMFQVGSWIAVSGRFEQESYTNKEGKEVTKYVLTVLEFDTGPSQSHRPAKQQQEPENVENEAADNIDDEPPF